MTAEYLMKLPAKLKKVCNYSLIVILSAVIAIIIGALTPTKWFFDTSKSCDVDIRVVNAGLHSDIIIPVKTKNFDWNKYISLEDIGTDINQKYRYLSFGWGERDFYLNTPTVADIKIHTVFKALFYPNNSAVMHVQGFNELPDKKYVDVKSVRVSYDDYLNLAKFVKNTFKTDDNGRVNRIANGYRPWGGFYDALGSYSILINCNNWTAEALKLANVNTPLWSTLSAPIMWHLRSHC
jgi:uncharacterized protein (TIGR02117 family)